MTDRRPVEQDAAVERDVRVDRFPEGRAAPPPAPPVGVREPVRPPHRAAATMEREATNVRTEPGAGPWRGSGLVLGSPEGYWRDRVRWGPIWGGLVIALAGFVLLSAAAVAIGAQAVVSGANPSDTATSSAIASAVIAIITFFIGGWVASRTASAMSPGYGALNGLLVWALGVVLILALAAFGLGSLFGASGELLNQYRALGSPTIQGVDGGAASEGIRNSSLGAFIALLLPAIAAALGGWIGARGVGRTDLADLEADQAWRPRRP